MLKAQNFGIEIEFTGITREKAADIIAKELGSTVGRAAGHPYYTRKIKDSKKRFWKVMRDSSIDPQRNDGTFFSMDEYRCEFVSPICKYDDIHTVVSIVKALVNGGAIANASCGIHVHVDGANHTGDSLRQLVNFIYNRQGLIYDAFDVSARRQGRWCKPICADLYEEFKANKGTSKEDFAKVWYSEKNDRYYGDHITGPSMHYNETRYHALNLHALYSKGTVEFRLFNGTMDTDQIRTNIIFCLAVSAWAISAQNDKISFRSIAGYTASKKVTLMNSIIINRLGLTGDEFKDVRSCLLKNLKAAAHVNAAA